MFLSGIRPHVMVFGDDLCASMSHASQLKRPKRALLAPGNRFRSPVDGLVEVLGQWNWQDDHGNEHNWCYYLIVRAIHVNIANPDAWDKNAAVKKVLSSTARAWARSNLPELCPLYDATPELRSENMTRHPGFWVDDWETSATSSALMGKSPDGHKAASAYLKNLRKDMVQKPVRL